MSKRDTIHWTIRRALEKDGWIITHDPLIVPSGGTTFKMDLGAEKWIEAEKDNEKIVVEIKTFGNPSVNSDIYGAFGKYTFYTEALEEEEIDRELFIAISEVTYKRILKIPFFAKRIHRIQLLIVDIYEEKIIKWTN